MINGNKSAKPSSKYTSELVANKKPQNYVAEINDKCILQRIEEVFNGQEEILKSYLASNQKLTNERIDKLTGTVQQRKACL